MSLPQFFPTNWTPFFSGHETFVLRGLWLKKAYDLLQVDPALFRRDDAFVLLGVGKNMAQSIRYWGRVTGILTTSTTGDGLVPTHLGHALLADNGWDPFLVSPTSAWMLHWHIAARPEGAPTWFYTFNLLRSSEWRVETLAQELIRWCADHQWRQPSLTTVRRDIECMIQCYNSNRSTRSSEDGLGCPLIDLALIQQLPNHQSYRLSSQQQASLPDALVAFAILEWLRRYGRRTISFNELAYAPCAPGRVFHLDEDSLLSRLQQVEAVTNGDAYYSDQAGIRQVAWQGDMTEERSFALLNAAFAHEVLYDNQH